MTLPNFFRYLTLILGSPLVIYGLLKLNITLIVFNLVLIGIGLFAAHQIESIEKEKKK